VPLGLDTLAVSVALGARDLSAHDRLRVSLVLSSFEAAMPLIGLMLGRAIGTVIGAAADYLAIALLAVVGAWMLLSNEETEQSRAAALSTGHGAALIGLGLSVSIDELVMGLSIGLLHLPIWLAVALIGVQAFLVAQLGMWVGWRGAGMIGERAERLAGVALFGLALFLLVDRLAF
jgi:putative Mn2+ efflux pump MntP